MEKWLKRILSALNKSGKKGLSLNKLQKKCKVDRGEIKKFRAALDKMLAEGQVMEKNDRLYAVAALGFQPAVIKRLQRTYGFAELSDGQEVFVLGSKLKGTLPGDRVLLHLSRRPRGNLPEGEVRSVVEENQAVLSGVLRETSGGAFFLPDILGDFSMRVLGSHKGADNGDKVLAKIIRRGDSHRSHLAEIISCFGSSQRADSCAQAMIAAAGVSTEFPASVLDEARALEHRGITEEEEALRLDLRDSVIFTIDGADAKDLDDAVSLEKKGELYDLGVHIADVTHYVRPHSQIDEEAFARGTSIYYADQVIPMLPKELSNGICSLNPHEDRLAFSALMTLSAEGELIDYTFRKTLIRSRVKGTYHEVNALLEGNADQEVREKYAEVQDSLFLMKELRDLRIAIRKKRGAPTLESAESRLILDEQGKTTDVMPRVTGLTESIIEEFMLLANEAAASVARKAEMPFVYRVHEHPDPERISNLKETLQKLNLSRLALDEKVRPGDLAEILDAVRGQAVYPIVNEQVLRSMAKARYSQLPLGHFGLALENYAHFTAPIRRYPDLTIHRILTSWVKGESLRDLNKKYGRFAVRSAEHSSTAEQQAANLERSCEDCYKAEYMHGKIGEEFDGIISSVTSFGFYVELPNTVEGLVRMEDLPEGEYFFDGLIELTEMHGGRKYRLGDPVRVRCTGTDVNAGNIDFVPA